MCCPNNVNTLALEGETVSPFASMLTQMIFAGAISYGVSTLLTFALFKKN